MTARALLIVVLLEGLSVQNGTITSRQTFGEYKSVPACYVALDVIQRRIIAGLIEEPGGVALTCLPLDQ